MALNATSLNGVVTVVTLIFAVAIHMVHADNLAPASAPAPAPTSDGTAIDQAVAYILMALALVLTYLIH